MNVEEYAKREKANSPFWKPDTEGESMQGTFVEFREGKFGINAVLQGDHKEIILPRSRMIGKALVKHAVQAGDVVTVTYKGEFETDAPQPTKSYLVSVEKKG